VTFGKLMVAIASSLLLVTSALGQSSGSPQPKPAAKQAVRQLEISIKPWTGDFDQMLQRRIIRVLVPYSRTLYFNDKGHERGITADTARDFERYNFDPLMLAAQGYQESQLNQNAKSPVGAIGVMQVMPATGAELKVGDIKVTEPNIHAGAKYMDQLMTKYFSDANFSENDRSLFAFASYDAGPGNISKMRKEAAKRGLDPDRWFNNVEVVTAEKIGMETTTYVRNIYPEPRGPRVPPVGELVLWHGMFAPCGRFMGTTGFARGAP
jgi:membrane-bound lytic murein transglycosylase MltF